MSDTFSIALVDEPQSFYRYVAKLASIRVKIDIDYSRTLCKPQETSSLPSAGSAPQACSAFSGAASVAVASA